MSVRVFDIIYRAKEDAYCNICHNLVYVFYDIVYQEPPQSKDYPRQTMRVCPRCLVQACVEKNRRNFHANYTQGNRT